MKDLFGFILMAFTLVGLFWVLAMYLPAPKVEPTILKIDTPDGYCWRIQEGLNATSRWRCHEK